jgi:aminobenzoyl-glutamate utilization protein B
MDDAKAELFSAVESRRDQLTALAERIWENPEVAFEETASSALLQEALADAGFDVEAGVAGMETAFVARYGEGSPVVGTMGEFDALPGMSQVAAAEREPREEGEPGHGCGHNLFGVGSLGGALAAADAVDRGDVSGTVVYFGTPAEEGGAGKVHMVEAGLFDDVEAVVSWHPGWYNAPSRGSCLAVDSYSVEFEGTSAHAAASPESGRSALDGLQLLNTAVEYMREHVPEAVRLHYVVEEGGDAPNVVPAHAKGRYLVRAPRREQVERIGDWLTSAVEGAAMMSDTEGEALQTSGMYGVLPNDALADAIRENMATLGDIDYTDDQRELAADLRESLGDHEEALADVPEEKRDAARESAMFTDPIDAPDAGTTGSYSTDSGDVSWNVPLGRFTAATWPVGTPAHSWQAVAASGSVGVEAGLYASKVVAATLYDLMDDPDLRAAARAEFEAQTDGTEYEPPLESDLPPAELASR